MVVMKVDTAVVPVVATVDMVAVEGAKGRQIMCVV
jgi:hypothetical protein